MRESDKGAKGDHRTISDPIPERADFIKHIKDNANKEQAEQNNKKGEESKK